jgi:hypothetical protein
MTRHRLPSQEKNECNVVFLIHDLVLYFLFKRNRSVTTISNPSCRWYRSLNRYRKKLYSYDRNRILTLKSSLGLLSASEMWLRWASIRECWIFFLLSYVIMSFFLMNPMHTLLLVILTITVAFVYHFMPIVRFRYLNSEFKQYTAA